MGHFAPPKDKGHLDPVPPLQEPLCMVELDLIIMLSNLWLESDFLDMDDALFPARRFFLLFLFVLVFAVIHHAADRRRRLGGNFHQVKTIPDRLFQRLPRIQDTQLFALGPDQSDLIGTNPVIDSYAPKNGMSSFL